MATRAAAKRSFARNGALLLLAARGTGREMGATPTALAGRLAARGPGRSNCVPPLGTLTQRQEGAGRMTGEELPRAADLLMRIADHFRPLRDPADRPRHRE